MGEVYRAIDTNLKRHVALKVLRTPLTADSDRLPRFQREAEVLASLNHPNIASIYGLEEADGIRALVMEFVDGQTLADRIVRGAIPMDEALPIARQIAEALEAAHEHGIVHRDLKPANVMVRPDGTVKVLDFGLARLVYVSPFDGGVATSPVVTRSAMTRSGVIMGTVAYMSPEQAKGERVDARADIWALGCVLYEMITGRAAFALETVAETLARVIEREPAWEALPANTSSNIRRLLHRCLEKDPKRRLHAAADVRIAIEDAFSAPETDAPAIPSTPRSTVVVAWLVASVAIIVAVTAAWSTVRRGTPHVASLRLDVNTAPTRDSASFALSPDGRRLVFVALEQETPQLWLRELDQTDPQRLVGTEGASLPFWAPSSRSIGFFADGWLKRLDLAGGRPQLLAQARNPMGATWNPDGLILYSPAGAGPLMIVPATGGTPTAITRLSPGDVSHRFPAFLPDGDRFLFTVLTSAPQDEGVYVGSLSIEARDMRHHLMAVGSAADYATSGYVLMVREGVLIAVPFDVRKGKVSGDPITLATQVASDPQRRRAAFSVSASGLVAYRSGPATSPVTELAWIQRDGRAMATLPVQGFPTLTTDGQHIAVTRQTMSRALSNTDIWLIDTARGAPQQFTFDRASTVNPCGRLMAAALCSVRIGRVCSICSRSQ